MPPADYPAVASLGINTVQFWAWHTGVDAYGVSRGLAKASANGLKVIYEFNHKGKRIYQDVANNHANNPALLMWYGLDEPAEGDYAAAGELRSTLHTADENHPIYTVSCRADLYVEPASFTDVFAIDPYGKPQVAAERLPLAVSAMNGAKPLICVPGAFGKEETPEEMRATAYLALAYDARGLIWYPWHQMGGGPLGVGCKNSPVQQAAISNICAEVRTLFPYLLSPVRQSFASEDGRLRCLYARSGSRRCVLMVNSTPEALETEACLPSVDGEKRASVRMKDLLGNRQEPLDIKDGRFRLTLEPYGTRVYGW